MTQRKKETANYDLAAFSDLKVVSNRKTAFLNSQLRFFFAGFKCQRKTMFCHLERIDDGETA